MKKTISIISFCLLISTFINAQEGLKGEKLKKVWEVTDGMDVPESAFFNKHDNTIYVSNIIGNSEEKDGLGFISKISPEGMIIQKEWVKGLNAPKGINSTKTKLYVTDIDRVLEIELSSGNILRQYKNSKSKSLNDVTITDEGQVFISDSGGNCIFLVGKDSLEVFIEDGKIKGMNGIFSNEKFLYIGAQGKFLSINVNSKEIKVLAENVGYLDGIEMVSEGVFVTSDWRGVVQLINVGGSVEKLIDTSSLKVNAADLGYIPSKKMIIVPAFFKNKVVAYILEN